MKGVPNLTLTYALVCDDIRREDSGKLIFIGVYARDVRVSKTPATLVLSLAVNVQASKALTTDIEIRWLVDGAQRSQIKGQLVVEEPGPAMLTVTGLIVTGIEDDATLEFEWRAPDQDWAKLYEIPILASLASAA